MCELMSLKKGDFYKCILDFPNVRDAFHEVTDARYASMKREELQTREVAERERMEAIASTTDVDNSEGQHSVEDDATPKKDDSPKRTFQYPGLSYIANNKDVIPHDDVVGVNIGEEKRRCEDESLIQVIDTDKIESTVVNNPLVVIHVDSNTNRLKGHKSSIVSPVNISSDTGAVSSVHKSSSEKLKIYSADDNSIKTADGLHISNSNEAIHYDTRSPRVGVPSLSIETFDPNTESSSNAFLIRKDTNSHAPNTLSKRSREASDAPPILPVHRTLLSSHHHVTSRGDGKCTLDTRRRGSVGSIVMHSLRLEASVVELKLILSLFKKEIGSGTGGSIVASSADAITTNSSSSSSSSNIKEVEQAIAMLERVIEKRRIDNDDRVMSRKRTLMEEEMLDSSS